MEFNEISADDAPGAVCGSLRQTDADNAATFAWRERLYTRFRGQAYPLLVFEEGVLPAASLWAGARLWSAAFREAGLQAGDRIVLSLPPSPAFLYVLIAALWNGLTLAILAFGQDVESAVAILDARSGIGGSGFPSAWRMDDCGLPAALPHWMRTVQSPPTPDVRLLLATSGTTSSETAARATMPSSRWIALSDRNLLSVLDSHAPHLNLEGARLLSVLPWHHAFGLILDLLPALFAGAEIVRDGKNGRDPEHTLALLNAQSITHLSAVPLLMERMARVAGGEEALRRLQGGIVGGAAVDAGLASLLATTRLRAGYGQTEASPGIALGQPGEWAANFLGRPVGCRTRLNEHGALLFSGTNACLGAWQNGGLARLPADRWVNTGDLARQEGQTLYFAGRACDSFKLSNGRWIHPTELEQAIKRRFPMLREALLYSPDGNQLHLLVASDARACLPDLNDARECLGLPGAKLHSLQEIPLAAWQYTPKGSLQREQTLQTLSFI